jgi:hypothetical protein
MHPGKATLFYRLLYRIYSFRTRVRGGGEAVNIISYIQYLRQLLAGSRLKNRVNSAQMGDLLENLG